MSTVFANASVARALNEGKKEIDKSWGYRAKIVTIDIFGNQTNTTIKHRDEDNIGITLFKNILAGECAKVMIKDGISAGDVDCCAIARKVMYDYFSVGNYANYLPYVAHYYVREVAKHKDTNLIFVHVKDGRVVIIGNK